MAEAAETAPLLSADRAITEKGRGGGSKWEKWRNAVGFLILGVCNNYPFIIMLSGAFDILDTLEDDDHSGGSRNESVFTGLYRALADNTTNTTSDERECHEQSTGVVLLANILPTVIIKVTLPYVMNFIPYWIRVLTIVAFSAVSFVVVGLNGLAFTSAPLVFFGIVCASISSGFGELTFLAFTARYHESSVAGWSSGTGMGAVVASLLYLLFRTFLSTQTTILIQLFVPVLYLVTFTFIVGKPKNILSISDYRSDLRKKVSDHVYSNSDTDEKAQLIISNDSGLGSPQHVIPRVTSRVGCTLLNTEEAIYWKGHIQYIPRLLKYMVPLFLVYIAEYMINQGLYELLFYPHTQLGEVEIDQGTQYRILQVMYQIGVLISRSSIFFIHIKHFWILALLQVANFVFLFCEAIYLFIPSFWITFCIILYEGLLGGGTYANAFLSITKQVPEVHREFSMGLASVADSAGIAAAGVASIFIHKYICHLPS